METEKAGTDFFKRFLDTSFGNYLAVLCNDFNFAKNDGFVDVSK